VVVGEVAVDIGEVVVVCGALITSKRLSSWFYVYTTQETF